MQLSVEIPLSCPRSRSPSRPRQGEAIGSFAVYLFGISPIPPLQRGVRGDRNSLCKEGEEGAKLRQPEFPLRRNMSYEWTRHSQRDERHSHRKMVFQR